MAEQLKVSVNTTDITKQIKTAIQTATRTPLKLQVTLEMDKQLEQLQKQIRNQQIKIPVQFDITGTSNTGKTEASSGILSKYFSANQISSQIQSLINSKGKIYAPLLKMAA